METITLFDTCGKCQRRIPGGGRCSMCYCERCGAETLESLFNLCAVCDEYDINLAESGDIDAMLKRLEQLRFEVDVERGLCPRCRGFGRLQLPRSGDAPQVLVDCSCNRGWAVGPQQIADKIILRAVDASQPCNDLEDEMLAKAGAGIEKEELVRAVMLCEAGVRRCLSKNAATAEVEKAQTTGLLERVEPLSEAA